LVTTYCYDKILLKQQKESFYLVTEVTVKLQINKPVASVFEALIDREKIGNYWFTSSSENWTQGQTIILKYEEYKAEVSIRLIEMVDKEKIVFSWGEEQEDTIVSIELREQEDSNTIIEVRESGFRKEDPQLIEKLLGQKEGWVYTLTCLKGYLEHGINDLRASLVFA